MGDLLALLGLAGLLIGLIALVKGQMPRLRIGSRKHAAWVTVASAVLFVVGAAVTAPPAEERRAPASPRNTPSATTAPAEAAPTPRSPDTPERGPTAQQTAPDEAKAVSASPAPKPTEAAATEPVETKKSAVSTQARVSRAVDGDTLVVVHVAGPELPSDRVRLIGVDTPESTTQVEPYGKEAAAFTARQLEGKVVWLVKDVSETDRYGRALRYVWLTEPPAEPSEAEIRKGMFNAVLLLDGYAQAATFPPDVRYAELFRKFAAEAREAKRGLWGLESGSGSGTPPQPDSGAGGTPSATPVGKACPAGYPVKGNLSSSGEKIYHVPGGQFYDRTIPEECFRDEAAAQAAGYRRSKR